MKIKTINGVHVESLEYRDISKRYIGIIIQFRFRAEGPVFSGIIDEIAFSRSTKSLRIDDEWMNGLHENCEFELLLYPRLHINFSQFKKIINNLLYRPIFNEDSFVDLYQSYRRRCGSMRLEWVLKNGYEPVDEWAKYWFESWLLETHGNCLKSRSGCSNIKPSSISCDEMRSNHPGYTEESYRAGEFLGLNHPYVPGDPGL